MERLQKIISAAGVASRRKAEELITSGLVQVNGQTVTELGAKADADKDHIRVNGKLIKASARHVYIMLNKPKGCVTTLSDPEGRPTIVDLLRGVKERVYPVGRLDYASEGLLLLTNDGELANSLTKAASHVPKTYLVKVSGQPSDAAIEQLRAGIQLPDRKGIPSRTAPAGIQLAHKSDNPWYEVTLIEGRNRQIRAMFEQTGHHVEKLKRVRYGPFTLDVHPGKFRHLLPEEVDQLRATVGRGTGVSAESAVRSEEDRTHQSKNLIAAELKEEAATPPRFRPTPVRPAPPQREPKREPKLFGKIPPRPRPASRYSDSRNSSSARGKGFPKSFAKKGPYKAAPYKTNAHGERASTGRPGMGRPGTDRPGTHRPDQNPRFVKRADAGAPRRPASTGPRPEWKKPERGTGERPAWKQPTGSGSPRTGAPRKWTQGAPSRPQGARPFTGKVFDRDRPASFRPKPAGGDRPFDEKRGDSRDARPDRPRTTSAKAPFWQGADKRRPRKPKEEGDSQPVREARPDSDRPRRPAAPGTSRPEFGRPKFDSRKPGSIRPGSRKPGSRKPGSSKPGKDRR